MALPDESSTVEFDETSENQLKSKVSIGIQVDIVEEISQDLVQVPASEQITTAAIPEENASFLKILTIWFRNYVKKFRGLKESRAKRLPWHEYIWSFIGALIGIAVIALIHFRVLQSRELSFLIGSFGASAVLVFGAPRSPLAQPRNLVGGHVLSALCGCIWRVILYRFEPSITCALAVATSIVIMQLTETTHPPGGATALLAVTAVPVLPWANFLFLFMPTLSGSVILLIVALTVNNLSLHRSYPTFWW